MLVFTTFKLSASDIELTELSEVDVYSMGFNGFIAEKMPQQILYEKVFREKNAVALFKKILNEDSATPESKLFAACGLWHKGLSSEIVIKKEFEGLSATVLTGDILRNEALPAFLLRIKQVGC